jgi:hypothetical protein
MYIGSSRPPEERSLPYIPYNLWGGGSHPPPPTSEGSRPRSQWRASMRRISTRKTGKATRSGQDKINFRGFLSHIIVGLSCQIRPQKPDEDGIRCHVRFWRGWLLRVGIFLVAAGLYRPPHGGVEERHGAFMHAFGTLFCFSIWH